MPYLLKIDKIEPLAFIGKIYKDDELVYETEVYTLESLARSEIEIVKTSLEKYQLDIN